MNEKELAFFKEKLLKEKALIEEELSGIALQNPNNPNDWQATTKGMEIDTADENELGDLMEELDEKELVTEQLQVQLKDVNDALEKIEKGNYGICELTGESIDKARLEANPSARTAIHKKE